MPEVDKKKNKPIKKKVTFASSDLTLPTSSPQNHFSGRWLIQTAFSESFPIRPAAPFLDDFNIFFLAKNLLSWSDV